MLFLYFKQAYDSISRNKLYDAMKLLGILNKPMNKTDEDDINKC